MLIDNAHKNPETIAENLPFFSFPTPQTDTLFKSDRKPAGIV